MTRARELAIDSEREEVASEVRDLVARSGLSRQDFAERIGTSRSRLSTYMSGKVVPLSNPDGTDATGSASSLPGRHSG